MRSDPAGVTLAWEPWQQICDVRIGFVLLDVESL
jgi:hypothetical protein